MRLPRRTRTLTSAALGAALVASLGLASASTSSAMPSARAWFSLGDQLDGGIVATVEADGVLYAGGWFTEAGGEPADGVATYDGSTWAPLSEGPGFAIESMATDGSDVFAGGSYYDFGPDDSSPGGVAVWDGTTWTDLTGNLPAGNDIAALVYANSDLYAFGFSYDDPDNPATRSCLAMEFTGTYDVPAWSSIGTITSTDCMVNDASLSRSQSQIFVAGDFEAVDDTTANGVAVFDLVDRSWAMLGDGADFGSGLGSPYAIAEGPVDGTVVVVGRFWDADVASAMATWDGESWSVVAGFGGDDGWEGAALATDGSYLYVGGYFGSIDDVTMNSIARWDGTSFYPVGEGVTYGDGTYGGAYLIAPYDGTLIVSGDFEVAGTVEAPSVAYYGDAVAPGAPRAVKATAGTTSAKVSWSAPVSDGGAAITTYRVTAAPGGRTCTAAAPTRTCSVTGLTPGTTYRFTVKATNAVGTGPASTASAAVTIPRPASATYRTITTRVLFYPGDSRVGPKGAAALAALKARIPAGAKVTWVKVTGYVQGTASRFATNDSALALARAKASAAWLTKHHVGGAYTVGSGGVSGTTGLDRAAVVAIRYVVPAA
ncbi:MAG: fibronectin type III domain-containing protein [Candidatus Nanopelagicales bacterium]